MSCYLFMMVRIDDREQAAINVQKILTEYGCSVRTRLGLHDEGPNHVCMPSGVLILQLCTDIDTAQLMQKKLSTLDGVHAKLVDLSS